MDPDPRPPVWVGHILLPTPCLAASHAFMTTLGLRRIVDGDDFAVLELRGGTHLVLLQKADAAPGDAPFDFMVEDLDATHARLIEAGLTPEPIVDGSIHRSFVVQDPSGHRVTFNDSHVSDLPV